MASSRSAPTAKRGHHPWLTVVTNGDVSVGLTTHTTENAANTAARKLSEVWIQHQAIPLGEDWTIVAKANPGGHRYMTRPEAEAWLTLLFPLPIPVTEYADQEETVYVCEPGDRGHSWVGAARRQLATGHVGQAQAIRRPGAPGMEYSDWRTYVDVVWLHACGISSDQAPPRIDRGIGTALYAELMEPQTDGGWLLSRPQILDWLQTGGHVHPEPLASAKLSPAPTDAVPDTELPDTGHGPGTEVEATATPTALTDPARRSELDALMTNAAELEANRHGTLTRQAYESDFAHFGEWCQYTGLDSLPAAPETIYLYLAAMTEEGNAAHWAVPTLERRLSAIKWVHETSGHESPVSHTRVKELMAGIRRTHGRRPDKADALSTEQISQIAAGLDLTTLRGLRDRAMILFGFAGAFRRSELVSLTREQLVRTSEGYVVQLIRTKDDQEGHGRDTGIPAITDSALCPVVAIDAWLTAAEITEGPIFRRIRRGDKLGDQALTPRSFNVLLKQACITVGIPSDRISGHSVRAGHLTEAARNGAPDRALMYQAGHKSMETTHGYIRPGTVFRTNSANYLGLGDFAEPAPSNEAPVAEEEPA